MYCSQNETGQRLTLAGTLNSGEDRIRTCGTVLPVHRFSKPALSTTQPPPRWTTNALRSCRTLAFCMIGDKLSRRPKDSLTINGQLAPMSHNLSSEIPFTDSRGSGKVRHHPSIRKASHAQVKVFAAFRHRLHAGGGPMRSDFRGRE